MAKRQSDDRSPRRKALDEGIAAEPRIPPLELSANARPITLEEYLAKLRRKPRAFLGVVKNGSVRPLDPGIRLPEDAEMLIVDPSTG